MAKRVGSVLVIVGLLTGAWTSAAARTPADLSCIVVGTSACVEGGTCELADGDPGATYSFDLVAMTYQAPNDRGAITDFGTGDDGFLTFVLGGERLFTYKNADASASTTAYLYLSPADMRELRCNARYATAASEAETDARRRVAGHYYLTGVMETGSELLLRPDGNFAWFMSYGAVDQAAEGKWRVEDDVLVLNAASSKRGTSAFQQLRLRIDHGALLLFDADSGRYERYP